MALTWILEPRKAADLLISRWTGATEMKNPLAKSVNESRLNGCASDIPLCQNDLRYRKVRPKTNCHEATLKSVEVGRASV